MDRVDGNRVAGNAGHSLDAAPAPAERLHRNCRKVTQTTHPDVRPWFHEDAEPGPYTEDPEDGYPYDE
jgi:hypothetical protein